MKQTKYNFLYLLVFLFLGGVNTLQAQTYQSEMEVFPLENEEIRNQIPKYVAIGFGVNNSKFRDFATSPLFYKGPAYHISLSSLKRGDKKEVEFGFSFDSGSFSSSFNESSNKSSVKRLEFSYARLYRIGLFNAESINTKIGFLINGNGNLRINSALQNNAAGTDVFANLMGSFKITKDISRKVAKEKKFLFWRYNLKERKRNLAFRLNVGLVNSSFRNGYAYIGQSPVLNDAKGFDGYEFKIFSGFRASSSIDYTYYLSNKNAVQFSYIWDAYSTGGDLDKFEMAHHIFKLTLLFNTNNR